jgi:hypothetical protein
MARFPLLEASGIGQIGQHGYTDLIDSLQNVYRFPQKSKQIQYPHFPRKLMGSSPPLLLGSHDSRQLTDLSFGA